MGAYIFVNEEDRVKMRRVSDPEINESFQEALKCDPTLMITEVQRSKKKSWLHKREYYVTYEIYHETLGLDGRPYQAKGQISGSGYRYVTLAYLHGIYNGVTHLTKKP